MAGKLPAFGYLVKIAVLSEVVSEPCSAPEIVLESRFKLDRIHNF